MTQVPKYLLLECNSSNEPDIEDSLSIVENHGFLRLHILVLLLCLSAEEEGVSSVEKIAKVDKEKGMIH